MNPPAESTTTPSRFARLTRRAAWVALASWAVFLLGPLALLTVVGETRSGRAVGGLAVVAVGLLVGLGFVRGRPWVWAPIAVLIAVGVAFAVGVASWSRQGSGASATGLHSVFPRGGGRATYLPEIDVLKLGVTLVSRLAPGVDAARGRLMRSETLRLAREVEADPAARSWGSVLGLALDEVAGRGFDVGHYYAYVPATAQGEKLGALVFLHGNGGNFAMTAWAWKPFADRERMAVVCPTYGAGLWGEGGAAAVERARADAVSRFPVDPARVYLGGISDGGKGVTRAATASPERYRGLIYVSPTMIPGELSEPRFADAWKARHVFVAQGDRDWNVRKATVDPAVDLLRSQGTVVTYRVEPGEDHFLFFAKRAALFDALHDWLTVAGQASGGRSTE